MGPEESYEITIPVEHEGVKQLSYSVAESKEGFTYKFESMEKLNAALKLLYESIGAPIFGARKETKFIEDNGNVRVVAPMAVQDATVGVFSDNSGEWVYYPAPGIGIEFKDMEELFEKFKKLRSGV